MGRPILRCAICNILIQSEWDGFHSITEIFILPRLTISALPIRKQKIERIVHANLSKSFPSFSLLRTWQTICASYWVTVGILLVLIHTLGPFSQFPCPAFYFADGSQGNSDGRGGDMMEFLNWPSLQFGSSSCTFPRKYAIQGAQV